MKAGDFASLFPKGVFIVPEWLLIDSLEEAHTKAQPPSLELIPDTTQAVHSLDDLIPGDWVYFTNFKEYEEKHPHGAFAGENALYLGGDLYRGFGVRAMTYSDMNQFLIERYNEGLKQGIKGSREKSRETLDGEVPGILKTGVRRIAENEAVKQRLR